MYILKQFMITTWHQIEQTEKDLVLLVSPKCYNDTIYTLTV